MKKRVIFFCLILEQVPRLFMSPPSQFQHHPLPLMAGLSPENYLNSNEENEDAKLKRYFQASLFSKFN